MKTTDPSHHFTPHTLTALRYRLVAGDVDLKPLRILATRTLPWNDWQVTLHILGASHAVCLERNGVRLTELLTCLPPAETGSALFTHDATACREENFAAAGLCCSLHLEPFSLEKGDTLRHTPPENSLTLTYPHAGVDEESQTLFSPLPARNPTLPYPSQGEGKDLLSSPSQGEEKAPSLRRRGLGEVVERPGVRYTPITRIGWRLVGDSLLIETVHTYPEEGRGLRSLTRFTPTGAN